MLRQLIKSAAMTVPVVRRVFRQRDESMAEADRLRIELTKATSDAEHLRMQVADAIDTTQRLRSENDRLSVANAIPRLPEHAVCAYSHWGEDSIVEFIFSNVEHGRYLDIGCFHPALYSNSMRLYQRGWTGVNVDPNAFMIEQCRQLRPNDTNINKAVGARSGEIDYYSFHDWASSNTASLSFAEAISSGQNLAMPAARKVPLVTLKEIMDEHFPDAAPDFVNIDVEALDVDVLRSGDWTRYRPKLVAIEDIEFRFDAPGESNIYTFLTSAGYRLFSRCVYTNFFIENSFNAASFRFS